MTVGHVEAKAGEILPFKVDEVGDPDNLPNPLTEVFVTTHGLCCLGNKSRCA